MSWKETRERLIGLGIAVDKLPVEWQPDIGLHEANLHEANLRGADLCEIDLYGANLCEADLRGADLSWANLHGANLCEADLRGADLTWVDLYGANLSGANLCGANLSMADLSEADLRGADLRDIAMNWRSHDLIAEILRQAAGDDWQKRQLAGLILVSRDWCWKDFLRLHHPLQGWAMDVLNAWRGRPEEGSHVN